jgi:hypothetical protein
MNIFKTIANSILNIFKSAAEKSWNNLDKELQGHALTATALAQAIKKSIGIGYNDFAVKTSALTGLPVEKIDNVVLSIANDLGMKPSSVIEGYKSIQERAQQIDSDNGWNALWQNVMKFAATYISSGKLDWQALSLGIAEIAYHKLFKK